MSEFATVKVQGHTVSVTDSGECWNCEDAKPTTAMQTTVGGMLSMKIGVCEPCADELEDV